MPAENLVKFKSGSQEQYNSLEEKDTNTLYFINDELKIYKGDKPYVKSFWTGTDATKPEKGEEGILYIGTDTKKMYTWKPGEPETGEYVVAFEASMVTLDEEVTEHGKNGVTSEAIYSFVLGKIAEIVSGGGAEGVFVTQIKESDKVGTLTVLRGEQDESEVKVKLSGLAKIPTYDQDTRKITFKDADDQNELVINLGKDLVVNSGRYDSAEHQIILVLNDDSQTEIKIDVKDLVSDYSASEDVTGAVQITIDSADAGKTIKATLLLDEESKLKIEENKLTIDLSEYATSAALGEVSSRVGTLETTIQGLDETYLKIEDLDSKLTDYAKTSEIQGQISAVTENVTQLETKINQSLTWGTINV